MGRAAPCPCSSGLAYDRCCGPYHRGERAAPDPPALMRSRYSAFALREAEYLHRTLHPEHEDRSRLKDVVLRSIRESASRHRYPGLRVIDHEGPDEGGIARVLFHARVFEKGRDRSFVELSDFAHDGEGWRYLRGEGLPLAASASPPEGIAAFRLALSSRG